MATYRVCLLVLCIWSIGPSIMGGLDSVADTDAVSDIEIEPNPEHVPGRVLYMCIDQVISCNASGRPEPTYTWYCDEDQIIVEGQGLLVTEAFARPNNEPVECLCVAENVRNGQPHQVEKRVNFVAYDSTKCHNFLVELNNIAGRIGEPINLYTRVKKNPSNIDSAYVGWEYLPAADPGSCGEALHIWGEQSPVEIEEPLRFAHVYTDLGNNIYEYNLTINPDATLSGPYQAIFLLDRDVKTKAEVVIVDTLRCPPQGYVKEENEQIIIFCDTFYFGYKTPVLRWYTQDGELASNLLVVDNHVMATLNMTAVPKHDKLRFYCRLTFEADEDEAAAPVYTAECETYYHIIHGVTNVTVEPNSDDAPRGILEMQVGSYLNCSASGRPEPTYSWSCDDGQRIQETFIHEETVSCTCEVKNVVKSQPIILQKHVNFVVIVYDIRDVELQPNPDDAPERILKMVVGEFINCSADGRPDPTYSWSCNDGQVIKGPNLQVTDSFIRDENSPYTCECQAQNTINGQLRTAQKNVTFQVYYAVKDVELEPNQDDAPGGNLQMEVGEFINCTADSRPDPTYSWSCNDGHIIQGPNLQITDYFISDENTPYTCECQAQNTINGQLRTAQKNATFQVYYGVVNITIHPNLEDAPGGILEMSVGEFINCSADGRPEPTYSWNCDDGQAIPGSTLLIKDSFIRKGNRTVLCTCTAQNVVKGQSRTEEKQVYFVVNTLRCPPQGHVKEENEQILSFCDTYYFGYKTPVLRWYTQDGEVTSILLVVDNHVMATLNMTAVPRHDKLRFYCRLTFEADENEAAAPVYTAECETYYHIIHGVKNVTVDPNPDDAPGGILEMQIGSFLNCSASGRPEPTYSWTCDDGQVITGQLLMMTETFIYEDTVSCTCEVQNVVKRQPIILQKHVNFVVIVYMELQPNPDEALGGILEMQVGEFINCTAYGLHDPTYSWSCNDGQIIKGSTLLIKDSFIRKGNRTVLCTCTAKNDVKGQPRTEEKQVYFVVKKNVTGCSVWKRSSATIAKHETVIFQGIHFNEGGHYNRLTGEFLCPVDGEYYASVTGKADNTQDVLIAITKNGEYIVQLYEQNSKPYNTVTNSGVLRCEAGDVIAVTGYHITSYVYGDTSVPYSMFTVILVHKDGDTEPSSFDAVTAWKKSSQSVTVGDIVTFPHIIYDSPNYTPSTGTYTCPANGVYLITLNILKYSNDLHIGVEHNSNIVLSVEDSESGNRFNQVSNSVLVECAGDEEITVKAVAAGSVHGTSSYIWDTLTVILMKSEESNGLLIAGCSVWTTSIQSYSNNDIIRYNGISVNRGNHFNINTSQFVCPTEAVYHVTATAKKSSTNGLQVNVLHGTNTLFRLEDLGSRIQNNTVSSSALVRCAAGEVIQVKAAGSGRIYGSAGGVFSTFTVIKMN